MKEIYQGKISPPPTQKKQKHFILVYHSSVCKITDKTVIVITVPHNIQLATANVANEARYFINEKDHKNIVTFFYQFFLWFYKKY